MRLSVHRRQRSRWLTWEWHTYGGEYWFNLTLGHPDKHYWWAFDAYLYLWRKS